MLVEVNLPAEFQGAINGMLSKRSGLILNMEGADGWVTVTAEAPLNEMFGFSSELRSLTQVNRESIIITYELIDVRDTIGFLYFKERIFVLIFLYVLRGGLCEEENSVIAYIPLYHMSSSNREKDFFLMS